MKREVLRPDKQHGSPSKQNPDTNPDILTGYESGRGLEADSGQGRVHRSNIAAKDEISLLEPFC
jgi:hypothetical protein